MTREHTPKPGATWDRPRTEVVIPDDAPDPRPGRAERRALARAARRDQPVTKQPLPSINARDIRGHCPACGHPTLQVGEGGHLVCVLMDCPKPEAADELLHGVPACNAPGPWGDAHTCQLPAGHRDDHKAHDGCGWVDEQAAAQHPEPVTTEPASNDWPSRRAGLRDDIAAALEAADYSGNMRRGDLADAIMPVFYRAWPWLQAEAEDAVDIARLRADKTALQAALTDTLTVRRQHIGRITRRAAELEAERDRLATELRWYAEAESADAAAGSYALRAEHAEQQRDQLADTLRQVLAKFHPVHTADRRTVKGHTARVTPADHERWTAMLGQQPEPSPAAAIEVRDPRPRCEGSPTLIPRQLMADHMRDTHPEEQQP
jgi:hypothetical protein